MANQRNDSSSPIDATAIAIHGFILAARAQQALVVAQALAVARHRVLQEYATIIAGALVSMRQSEIFAAAKLAAPVLCRDQSSFSADATPPRGNLKLVPAAENILSDDQPDLGEIG